MVVRCLILEPQGLGSTPVVTNLPAVGLGLDSATLCLSFPVFKTKMIVIVYHICVDDAFYLLGVRML